MATRKRLRWTAILCCHAIANLASYRAGWSGTQFSREGDFWKRANGNFMDVAVLEWCKLFAEPRGIHGYRKVLSNPGEFMAELLAHLAMSGADFEAYCTGVRAYRDKFVAHLDDDPEAQYPQLDVAISSTKFLYRYLRTRQDADGHLDGLPRNLDSVYRLAFNQARAAYAGEGGT